MLKHLFKKKKNYKSYVHQVYFSEDYLIAVLRVLKHEKEYDCKKKKKKNPFSTKIINYLLKSPILN